MFFIFFSLFSSISLVPFLPFFCKALHNWELLSCGCLLIARRNPPNLLYWSVCPVTIVLIPCFNSQVVGNFARLCIDTGRDCRNRLWMNACIILIFRWGRIGLICCCCLKLWSAWRLLLLVDFFLRRLLVHLVLICYFLKISLLHDVLIVQNCMRKFLLKDFLV